MQNNGRGGYHPPAIKKKILSLLLAMIMLLPLVPTIASAAAVDSGTCGENLTWTLDDSGTLTISGTGDMTDWDSSSSAPWYSDRSTIKSLIIKNGVTSIGGLAFCNYDGLTSITIPDSVTSIGGGAFSECISLESITIPDSVISIGYSAFEDCSSLMSITIPDSVISIGDWAFDGCSSLESIYVVSNNRAYSSADGVLFNKDKTELICYPGGKSGSYVIPDGVISIGDHAFKYCSSLTSITIPDSVTSIGNGAFWGCDSLTSIYVASNNNTYSSADGVLFNKNKMVLICCPGGKSGSYVIPDSVTSVCDYSFYNCHNLTSITIPDSITSIGDSTFCDCSGLMSIIIPDSVTSIEYNAFWGCGSLTDVYYGGSEAEWDGIYIGNYGNTYLTNATIHYNSSGPPSGTFGNTNSTSTGAPIITSAKLTYSGKTYDIFSQAVTIDENSDITATIEAMVNNNGCSKVKAYVTQSVGKEIDITGICKDFKPGKEFTANKDIYILAVDEGTGKSTSKKTKLKISSTASASIGIDGGQDGLNFKLGKDVGFTLPDSVPVFGGTDIKWSFDFIPVTVGYDKEDDNKINVVIGGNLVTEEYEKNGVKRTYLKDFNFKQYKKDLSHAARTQKHSLKDLRKFFDNDKGKKKNMSFFKGMVSGSGKGNHKNNVDMMGYAEMKYIDGKWQFVEGVFTMDVEIKFTYEGQAFVWVVPVYYEIGGGVGAGFEGKMIDLNPKSFAPRFEGYLSAKVMGSIGGGIGISGVATAGASGDASLNIKTALMRKYVKSWGEGSAKIVIKVFGKTVADPEFLRGDFLIYETGNSKGLIKDNAVTLQSVNDGIYNIDTNQVYENESRAYAKNPTEWIGDEPQVSLMSVDYTNKDLRLLAENIYTESAPQICEIDGKKIMVMQWDNASRADADRTMLVYSVYDESSKTWSAPVAVADDGTADFYPCFREGYLVWQNEKATLTDDMTLTDIAKLGEIYISKWNGNGFDEPVQITDNNTLDTQPQIASNSNGASVAWTTNTENDIMGITGKNAIMQSDFDGTNWSSPTEIKSNLNAVTNITAGNVNNNFCVAYVSDDDNDLNTIDDRDIRIISNGTETQLTDNDVLDSNPVFTNNMIYYYSEGNIAYSDIDGTNKQTVFSEATPGLTDSFVVDSNDNGDTAIWWTKAVEGGAEVYSSLYKDNEWSDEIQVTSIGNKAKYPSGIINNDGSMIVAFNNGILEDNEIVKTDLYTILVNPSYDLELTDAYFDEDSMTAYATVKNNGELAVDSYTVSLNDSGVNASQTITEPLKAGESAEVEITYNKPENLTKRDVELSVAMSNGEEYNIVNNTAVFSIGNADIAVENVAVDENETTVSADVSNIGYDDARNVKVQLRDSSADGAVIEEKTVNLAVGAKESVEFTIDKSTMRFFDATKQLYVAAICDFDEVSMGNNDGYVMIGSPLGSADYETEILSYNEIDGKYVINSIARNNTDAAVSCVLYSAVYSPDGALKACGTVTADIDADNDTGVDITVPCTIETGDTVKTFMWSDKMEPLAKMGELVIE